MRIGVDMLGIQAEGSVAEPSPRTLPADSVRRGGRRFVPRVHPLWARRVSAGRDPRRSPGDSCIHKFRGCGWARPHQGAASNGWRRRTRTGWTGWWCSTPWSLALGMGPPARPLGGLKLAAVVPDVTPFCVSGVRPDRAHRG